MDRDKNIVGIDIDCVLTELKPTMEHMAEYFNKPVAKFSDINNYILSNAYGVPKNEAVDFWKEEEEYLCRTAVPSKERIDKIYDKFVNDDTVVLIITSRHKKYADITAKWLKEHDIKHNMLIHTSGACKKPIIEHFNLDYMIDDKPDLFYAMEDSDTRMVCVDYEYNKNVPANLRMSRNGDVYYEERARKD